MTKRGLLILDYQRDNVYGCNQTKNSAWKCSLAASDLSYTNKEYYKSIMVGLTLHPIDHCSFENYIPNCVKYTLGASIDDYLFNSIVNYTTDVSYYIRGELVNRDEKSFLSSTKFRSRFLHKIRSEHFTQIDVFGMSSSVIEFILDLCDFNCESIINVKTKFCASDDDNKELIKLLDDRDIKYDNKF